jgi:hypothetical protein
MWRLRSRGADRPDHFAACAVAVALPLDEAEFAEDVADAGRRRDFVHCLLQQHAALEPHAVWLAYEHHVRALRQVLDFAASLGVTVVRAATLASLGRLLAGHRTITMFGHFRGWDLQAVEMMGEPSFAALFRKPPDDAWARLRVAVRGRDPTLVDRLDADLPLSPADLRSLCETLADTQLFEICTPLPGVQVAPYPKPYWPWRNRLALGRGLPRLASPAVFEFRDRMEPLESVVDAIPRAFRGAIDFIVCNSVFIAEAARRRPECRVIANHETQMLGRRAHIYMAVLIAMRDLGCDYLDAATLVHAHWIQREQERHA